MNPEPSIGFDLDNTLGDFTLLMPLMNYLDTTAGYYDQEYIDILNDVRESLTIAIPMHFNLCNTIFRPNLLNILSAVASPDSSMRVENLFIYSNNSSDILLEIVTQAISIMLNNFTGNLFYPLIHRHHEIRAGIDGDSVHGVSKTRATISRITRSNNLNNVIFVDDLIHPDLTGHQSQLRYIKCNQYVSNPLLGLDDLMIAFSNSLDNVGISMTDFMQNNVHGQKWISGSQHSDMNQLHRIYQQDLNNYFRKGSKIEYFYDDSDFLTEMLVKNVFQIRNSLIFQNNQNYQRRRKRTRRRIGKRKRMALSRKRIL